MIPARTTIAHKGRRYWITKMDTQYASDKIPDGHCSKQYCTPGIGENTFMTNRRGKTVSAETIQITAVIRTTVFLDNLAFTGKTIARYLSAVIASKVPMETDKDSGSIM